MHQIASYFYHFLKSNHYKKIQSQEVYRFYQSILIDKKTPAFSPIEDTRKSFLKNKSSIPDFQIGAGSNKKQKRIADIAKTCLILPKHGRLLSRLIRFSPEGNVLELGTSLGISTQYLSLGIQKQYQVISIEGNPHIYKIALSQNKRPNVKIINAYFDDVLETLLDEYNPVVVYIDGNHTYEATVKYFNQLKKNQPKESVWIFDDIYWSKEMTRAWHYIKNNCENAYTFDLYRIGIVWNNTARVKQHFRFRY